MLNPNRGKRFNLQDL